MYTISIRPIREYSRTPYTEDQELIGIMCEKGQNITVLYHNFHRFNNRYILNKLIKALRRVERKTHRYMKSWHFIEFWRFWGKKNKYNLKFYRTFSSESYDTLMKTWFKLVKPSLIPKLIIWLGDDQCIIYTDILPYTYNSKIDYSFQSIIKNLRGLRGLFELGMS